jgi:GNAT superfamily N-acetyltransferase
MTSLRAVETDTDLEIWAAVKSGSVPNEPVTAEQLRVHAEDGRLLLLAERGSEAVGCGIGVPSHFPGHAFLAARVLPAYRCAGVGTTIAVALFDHARALGRERVITFVDAAEPHSIAFAERYGLEDVDVQLEQRRTVGAERCYDVPAGIELVALGDRREELLRVVWPVAQEGYADMPLPGDVVYTLEDWLRDEATRPDGSFAAFENGEAVGYAGLGMHAHGPAVAEHGLTVVRRDRRRRGIATALKRAQLEWASDSAVAELITWTQRGNEGMQTLNRALGYIDTSKVITYQGPLPGTG